jgi:RNAse (barnase) inhibitor barstar
VPVVEIPTSKIVDWDSFHDTFAEALGFPDFYGRNMNAWVDCLTYGDDLMTKFRFGEDDVLTLLLEDAKDLHRRSPELYDAVIECAAFVNWRRIETGDRPVLALAFR